MRQARRKLICPNCGAVMLFTGEESVEVVDMLDHLAETCIETHTWRSFECDCGCRAMLSIPVWRLEQLEELSTLDDEGMAAPSIVAAEACKT